MFAVIRLSYLKPENLKSAALDRKEEWGFHFVCSDENKLKQNTVMMDVDLS